MAKRNSSVQHKPNSVFMCYDCPSGSFASKSITVLPGVSITGSPEKCHPGDKPAPTYSLRRTPKFSKFCSSQIQNTWVHQLSHRQTLQLRSGSGQPVPQPVCPHASHMLSVTEKAVNNVFNKPVFFFFFSFF